MRRSRAILIRLAAVATLIAVVLLIGLRRASRDHALGLGRIERTTLGPGLELLEAVLVRGDVESGRLVVLYAETGAVVPELLINEGQRRLGALAPGALVVTNAGYFTAERRPTGLLVSGGRALSPFVREGGGAGSGVLVLEQGAVQLLERERVGQRSFAGAALAIQAGPRVIEPGGEPGIRRDDGIRANRTVIGADYQGRLALAAAYAAPDGGTRTGPTLFELQHLLGAEGLGEVAEHLAFAFALNLDGGPSTGFHLRAPERTVELPEAVRVHSVLVLRTP